jgi:repressor LexA
MIKLTAKQQQILDYIKKQQRENGYAPSVREIAEAVDLASPSSVQHHINALVRHGFLAREASKPRTLTFGSEERAPTNGGSTDDVRAVPYLGDVAAGIGLLAEQSIDGATISLPRSLTGGHDQVFALRVRGDSMVDAGIFDGDDIIVRAQESARNGDLVVAGISEGTEGTVKIYRSVAGRSFLEARNSTDPRFAESIPFDPAVDRIFGIVVGLLRKYN